MEAEKYLEKFYETIDENSRLDTRYGHIEFVTTMKYIEKHLKPGDKIIEIGAGTGRYSHTFARMGFEVDAVELLEHNIEIFKSNTAKEEKITIRRGNAIDLSEYESDTYDITLLLGPMYHLFTEEEKIKALSEAIRVTKKGGIIFAAYCMGDAAVLMYGFKRGKIKEIIEKCMINAETFETFSGPWDIFELHRKEDIDALMKNFNTERLHFLATDGYANHIRDVLDEMDDETYELFVKYHLATCERQDMFGYSNHTLDVFRKK
ncbi:MAG: class I SAM-dependent methyltransferase [Ruminococcaceae bacterium]|nr:class I SAM-dependent methyltransferase [Oscillospiraceae bacterium]